MGLWMMSADESVDDEKDDVGRRRLFVGWIA